MKALTAEFYGICNEVGEVRFRRGVNNIINNSDLRFFPNVSEFRGYLPPAEKRSFCGKCIEGFVRVPDIGGDKHVRLCECREFR